MKKILGLLVLAVSLAACNSAKEPVVQQADNSPKLVIKNDVTQLSESEKSVYDQLAVFATSHIKKSNSNVVPNKKSPKIEKRKNVYVATYAEYDPDSVSLELIPTPHRQYTYLAKIKYRERMFQCEAESKNKALKGQYNVVGSRGITEVLRYKKGKWCY